MSISPLASFIDLLIGKQVEVIVGLSNMAKVAAHGALTSASLQIGGDALKVGPTVKRKTPSELRGEQLKRTNVAELVSKSLAPSEMDNGLKKTVPKDDMLSARPTLEKCSHGTFLSVTELSSGGQKLSGLATVDMDKALKGLAVCEAFPTRPPESSQKIDDLSTGSFCSEFHVTGLKVPVDFTLKTYMRLVSSSSVNWLNRLITCGMVCLSLHPILVPLKIKILAVLHRPD
ncbi:hypothetical protein ES332_A04G078600v1 [Gossypium tomentosum]|uniref:Uncharacterized protein n=1 Tax=Gossypium tomentosum TaxID=34277 RepID=A0A5D2QYU5_GOSTO|nr:hypothetical protein ES332_A04G078600v1 [Gossypium tomentosum]